MEIVGGIEYLPEVAHIKDLPESETYLILTHLLGDERTAHVLRWQDDVEDEALWVMDPCYGRTIQRDLAELVKAKCLFVRLRAKDIA